MAAVIDAIKRWARRGRRREEEREAPEPHVSYSLPSSRPGGWRRSLLPLSNGHLTWDHDLPHHFGRPVIRAELKRARRRERNLKCQ